MSVQAEAIEAVRNWLVDEFPRAHVEHAEIFDHDVVLFRASDHGVSYELEVSEGALRDLPAETIVGDLREQQVGPRLGRDPTMRLCYYRRRDIPHLETRHLICDERMYRIVRDAEHNVAIPFACSIGETTIEWGSLAEDLRVLFGVEEIPLRDGETVEVDLGPGDPRRDQ